MTRYFELPRVTGAIQHLAQYESKWVIVPLVFAVNEVTEGDFVNCQAEGKAGTSGFLNRYFHGSLIGLPSWENGNSALRPNFRDVVVEEGDHVAHQRANLWGSVYSSRGYREMGVKGLLENERSKYRLKAAFWKAWEEELPADFRFAELLVWLSAFDGFPDEVTEWDGLFRSFLDEAVGPGRDFPAGYSLRFNLENALPWPATLLKEKPTAEDFQRVLVPSRFKARPKPKGGDLSGLCKSFSEALREAHLDFGRRHDSMVRSFLASLATKRFVILSGTSGTGKSQIAIKFGEWLAAGRLAVIPVRPDWTGAEALFGFEDALQPPKEGRRAWQVPKALEVMLRAAGDPGNVYVLLLDEMNLAHVERYFADVLSGMESAYACLPNLQQEADGFWRLKADEEDRIPFPSNLFVLGTVNVDETTYMFSPKVLDRANTFEFRVESGDLTTSLRKPVTCSPAPEGLAEAFLTLAKDDDWHVRNPCQSLSDFADYLRTVHVILSASGFEFGQRVFYEAVRYAAFLESAGETSVEKILDLQLMQKILPRLHGSRYRLERVLCDLGYFSVELEAPSDESPPFDPLEELPNAPQLPIVFAKIQRMFRSLRMNQFASFTD